MKTFSLKEWGEQVINDPNPKKTIGWSVDKRNNASHNFQQLAELWACTLSDGKKINIESFLKNIYCSMQSKILAVER